MIWLRYLLSMLLAFVRPAATEPGAGDDGADDDPADDLDAGADDSGDDVGDGDAGDADDDAGDEQPRKGAGPSENERRLIADNERYQRELAEERALRKPAPAVDDVTKAEDARLADPKTTPLEAWQIQANRELRAGRNASNAALAQAYDVADKTSFASLAIKEPALFKRYEARVEEELTNMRKRGQNTNREAIYTFLLGKDMREGKFQKKKPGAAREAADANATARGRMPGVRSDVRRGGTAMTNKEKLEKRLENVQI